MRKIYILVCLLLSLSAQSTVRYVRQGAPGGGNGLSWATAYVNLQIAINASSAGDEIWIAAGTYTPGIQSSFTMKSGVKIYGGFAGNETSLSQRNWNANIVYLTANNANVFYNDATIDNSALLDGVVIKGGYASYGGGGMYNAGTAVPTISNVIFQNNYAVSGGGAMYCDGGSAVLTNVVFRYNQAGVYGSASGNGGAVFSDDAHYTYINCIFQQNSAGKDGGGMYSIAYDTTHKPHLTNVVFWSNIASGGAGGGMFTDYQSQPVITNCTFADNSCTVSGCGGGLHNYTPSGTDVSKPVISNTLFWNNRSANNDLLDVGLLRSDPVFTYCAFSQSSFPAGAGNVQITADPFLLIGSIAGGDGLYFTADDGLHPALCAAAVIDKGNGGATAVTTDAGGSTRKFDVPLIANGASSGTPPIDIGAYESQDNTTASELTGSIGGAHTIPYPQELIPDFVTSVDPPSAGMSISWEKSDDGGSNWAPAVALAPADSIGYRIPELATTTLFRRVVQSAGYCNVPYASNSVQIKVVNPNGAITGKVISKNGTPVKGILITAQRISGALSGSPANYKYTDTTAADGTYSLSPVYYGDPGSPASTAQFKITPSKAAHGFNPVNNIKTLSYNLPQQQNVNFTDTTVFSITGRTFQQCNTCNAVGGAAQVQTCPVDSVAIWKDNTFNSYTGFIDTAYGRYAVSVTDPGAVKIEPRYNSHTFVPVFSNVNVTDNVSGVNFLDTTTHVISGRLSSGCDSYIGDAVLEFTDILPNDQQNNPRVSCFRKRVSTNPGSGFYSIRLPARRYKVTVISFTSLTSNTSDPAYINNLTLLDFINNKVSPDSLMKDITKHDTVLNIRYERPPVLQMTGLPIVCSNPSPFAVMQQEVVDSFVVKAYQGAASFGCPVHDTNKVKIFTSIHKTDNTNEEFRYALVDTGIKVKIKGGTPYIISPYFKVLNIQFNDKYNRSATQINRNVVVTGVKADVATFTTVSPEVPFLVLHDPPGDNSFSFWQANHSVQNALRIYSAQSNNINAWAEVKIGTKFQAGIGISTETEVWGTINGSINVGATNTTSNETILTTSNSQYFSTSSSPDVTGGDGDLYVGAALNLIYAGSTEIKYSNCTVTSGRKLIVANNGFATQYIYTEQHIRDVVIPSLLALSQNSGNTPQQTANYLNQMHVWQQVLDNNATNKATAAFDKNISFDGAAGAYTNQTTSSVSKASTVEFSMNIDATLAVALGLEVAGSGVSGGVSVNFKTETGASQTSTILQETTTGYTLDDDDNGDYFSVNVKKDPVYNTPVFELAAGTSSCPQEEGTQPRDEMQLTVPVPSVSGVPANGDAQFVLHLGNTSQSGETRTYLLSFDQSSNPNGAIVTIGGSPVIAPIPYTISYLGEVQVTVTVKKSASSTVFAYEGLKFILTDACGGDSSKTALLSAYFVNSCSNITLDVPENNWVLTSADNNLLPVIMKDYNVAQLTSVTLEYSPAGTSNWTAGFTRTAAQLNANGAIGTQVNWNISGLADGAYNVRLKLLCSSGTVYSQRASGIIDRKPPGLFGNPHPTDDSYATGDDISFTYNENLDVSDLNNNHVTLRRLSNNTLIPVTVTGFENKIVISPTTSISSYVGDSFRVVVTGMADQYGNVKAKNDTTRFIVGSFTPASGSTALTVSISNPSVVYKNSGDTIKVYFNLPANATHDVRVNFAVAGTAKYGKDYTVRFPGPKASYTSFDGANGAIRIMQGKKKDSLTIVPIRDTVHYQPNLTVIISAMEGGDYDLGSPIAATGTITSDDGITAYTFTGNGNFSNKNNWQNGKKPLTPLASPKQVLINPAGTGQCILDYPFQVNSGASFTISAGKKLLVNGGLTRQ